MLLVDVWKINRARCGGRFNLFFFWLYPVALPACFTWDFLSWMERKLTPADGGSEHGR